MSTKPENADTPETASATEQTCGCDTQCGGKHEEHCQMPEVTFTTFVLSLASSALVQLGEVPNPSTGQTEENILIAKHTIDVLSMLRSKTQGCLDEDEIKILDGILYELRMKYVLKAK